MWRRGMALAVGALLFAPGAFAWAQLGGDAQRSGVMLAPDHPLDVVASGNLLAEGEYIWSVINPGLVSTPHGVFGVAEFEEEDTNTCTLFVITDLRNLTQRRGEPEACYRQSSVAAYDPVNDQILLCMTDWVGEVEALQARDARTLEHRWGILPHRDLDVAIVPHSEASPSFWECSGIAVSGNEGRGIAIFYGQDLVSGGRHRIVNFDLGTGEVVWVTTVPASAFAGGGATAYGESSIVFLPTYVTRTASGIVIAGSLGGKVGITDGLVDTAVPFEYPAAVWLDFEGNVIAGWSSGIQGDRSSQAEARQGTGSRWATSSGGLGAMAMGDKLVVMNPARRQAERVAPLDLQETLEDNAVWPAPRWGNGHIAVPVKTTVSAYSDQDFQRVWTWSQGKDWLVGDVVLTHAGEVFVVSGKPDEDGGRATLSRLRLSDGALLQTIPLPATPAFAYEGASVTGQRVDMPASALAFQLLPVPEGLLVWDALGEAVLLGRSDEALAPRASLDPPYPSPGGQVHLDVASATGLREVQVKWGDDGPLETLREPWRATWTFPEAGLQRVRVTSVYENGLTATREFDVDVGGTPPPPPTELSLMDHVLQTTRDNPDMVWTFVGLTITALGTLLTILLSRRGRSRLARSLRELERLREEGVATPGASLQALTAFGRALHREHSKGAWTDAQFQVLLERLKDIARPLRLRTLGGAADRLSPRFQRLVDTALHDALLRPEEIALLVREIQQETALSEEERAELRAAISAWG